MTPRVLGPHCDEDYPPVDGDFQNRTYFGPVGLTEVLAAWRRTAALIRRGRAPDDVGLYLHWPFCPSRCSYCYCDARAGESAGERELCLRSLIRELSAFAPALSGIPLRRVLLYGGTPAAAGAQALDRLFAAVRESYALAPGADVRVEASPAALDEAAVRALARGGATAVELGVDSLDAEVLARAGRLGQDARTAARALERLRSLPGVEVGVGLLFGLEGQTQASFLRDLGWVLRRGPHRLTVYGFDPRPQTAFARAGGVLDETARGRISRTVLAARRVLEAAGYRSDAGGWAPPRSLLGVGWSAMSRAFGSLWYQHAPLDGRRVCDDAIPPFFGMASSPSEEMRGHLVRSLFVSGRADRRGFAETFRRDLASVPALMRPVRALERSGLARLDGETLSLIPVEPEARARARRRLYSSRVRRALGVRRFAAGSAAPCLAYVRGSRR